MSALNVASEAFPEPGLRASSRPRAIAGDPVQPSDPADRLGLYDALAPLVTDAFGFLDRTSDVFAAPRSNESDDPFQELIADIAVQRSREETSPSGARRRALLRAVAELAETHAVAADLACETTAIDLPLDVPDPPPTGDLASPASAMTKSIVPDMIRTCRDRLAAHTSAADRTRLDIVATLFDHVLADDRLTADARNTLARLQLPVLRMALADDAFFEATPHPTRRLLDRLATAAAELKPDTLEGRKSFAAMERVVHQIIRGSFEDASEHGRLLAQFERSMASDAKARQSPPVVVTAHEPEDRDVLVIKATIQVSQLLAGIEIDRAIRLFMLDAWTRVMAEIALRPIDAERDALLARAKRLCFDLAWSVAPKTTSGERARLAGLLPTMIVAIRDGLRVIDYAADDEARFFSDWTRVLVRAVRAAPFTGFRDDDRGIESLPIDTFARRLREGSFGAEPKAEPIDDAAASCMAIPNDRSGPTTLTPIVVSELAKGEWFELREQRGFVRVRLSWVSPLRSFYLFIGADTAITRSLDPDALMALVVRGDLRRASGRRGDVAG